MKVESPQHLSDVLSQLVELREAAYLIGGGYHTHRLYPNFPNDAGHGPISVIIDLSEVRSMRFHREEAGWYILGSTLRLRQVMGLDPIDRYYSVLIKAIRASGSVPMRNQTTLGGHLSVNRENDPLIAGLLLLDAKIYFRTHQQDSTLSITDFVEHARTDLIPQDGLIHKIYLPLSEEWKDKVESSANFYRAIGARGGFWDPECSVIYLGRRENGVYHDNRFVLLREGYPMSLVRVPELDLGDLRHFTRQVFDSIHGAISKQKPLESGPKPLTIEQSAVRLTGMVLDGFIQEFGVQ